MKYFTPARWISRIMVSWGIGVSTAPPTGAMLIHYSHLLYRRRHYLRRLDRLSVRHHLVIVARTPGSQLVQRVSRYRRSWILVSRPLCLLVILLTRSPGCLMYLCFWYPPSCRATRMAFFSASITVAGRSRQDRIWSNIGSRMLILVFRCFWWSDLYRSRIHVRSRRSIRLAMALYPRRCSHCNHRCPHLGKSPSSSCAMVTC